jgi:carboxyl-terminal processing protease
VPLSAPCFQGKVGAQSAADESQLRDSLKAFTNVYALVEQNYAEPINGDKADTVIYDGAIPGMLRVLDPHSSFHDPKDYAKMQEDQRGHYYGVGMVIQQQQNKIYVRTPMKARLRSAGIQARRHHRLRRRQERRRHDLRAGRQALKGPKGTHVTLTTIREGQSKPLTFDLVRDEIPIPRST